MRHGDLQRLEIARQRAAQAGAVTIRYEADASLSLQLILRGSFTEVQALIDDVARTTMRLKLMETLRYVLLMRAVLAAHRGRRAEMEDALVELRKWDGDTEYHAPRVHGLARAFCALLEEDLPGAAAELTIALAAEDANPTIFAYVGRYGLNLLVQAVSGAADEATHRQLTADTASTLPWDRHFALLAAAVLAGRAGRIAEANQAVSAALKLGAHYEMARHLGLRLVSEAAFTDGWGEPVEWLRAAEDYFHRLEVPAVASACRALLRGQGVRIAPRRADADQIPRQLRLAGITPREHEVLRLLSHRLGNREIAAQLHLSPRTVERYVSNLMLKTGLANRIALSSMAATIMNQ
jgi:DNA-binding CsgD family transcriptional regulator